MRSILAGLAMLAILDIEDHDRILSGTYSGTLGGWGSGGVIGVERCDIRSMIRRRRREARRAIWHAEAVTDPNTSLRAISGRRRGKVWRFN